MKAYGMNELRSMFLDFFESKDHLILDSFSLVPENDKSLLLVNAGMAPLKPYFTGKEIPPKNRIATCQKCIRTGDIENVGKTDRHGTFFEMLGNFSFGDYFKKESLEWSWEFLTEVIGLEPERLYASVYEEDDEAYEIWEKDIGLAKEKIFRFGKEDNFWEHGAGPCGPCSEIFYDRGEKYGCGQDDCTVGCECDRYIEVWNNVFTQFNSDGKGNYEELENKNIDTGMGLERLATIVQDVGSIFDVDAVKAIRDKVCEIAGVEYGQDPDMDVSIRVITDHVRSVTFMTGDGIIPSNEGRGYVLRRLLRRASRHGRLLGIEGKFLTKVSKLVIEESRNGYPELEERSEYILKLISVEEDNFNKTLDQGLNILEDLKEKLESQGNNVLSGKDAFKLYDTYGFPMDLTKEILEENGMSVDEEGFKEAMEVQRQTARNAREETNYMGAEETVYNKLDPELLTEFIGYTCNSGTSTVIALTTEDEVVEELQEGQKGTVIVEETPFYATSGGQVADRGTITRDDSVFVVDDTIELSGGKIGHVGFVKTGNFSVHEEVLLTINEEQRKDTARNHSATHLLQKALRTVLGNHVEQAGSYVDNKRLRFDFTHFEALTKKEIEQVEDIVNDKINTALPVNTKVMSFEESKKAGAMSLFGEKYDDDVRVVSMGNFSKELCGGTHVNNTSNILVFKIISETSVAAGVRRIEAITGRNVIKYYQEMENLLIEASRALKAEPKDLVNRIEHLHEDLKNLNNENEKLKSNIAKESVGDISDHVTDVKGVKLIASKVAGIDMNGLRNLGDQLKDKLGEGVIVLISSPDNEKVNILVMVTDSIVNKGVNAGNLIKELAPIVGGGGGGRPQMAQAGGKKPENMDEVVSQAPIILEKFINS